jgi:DNA modification methylase
MVITLHTGATGSWNWEALSGWSAGDLQAWGMDADALKGWNNDATNLKELLNAEAAEPVDAEPQIDRAAELQEKWQTATGQLWKLGEHRLLIGDCTVRENVERLMGEERADMTFIDPPYNALKSWNKDEAHGETRLDPSKWFDNDNMEWSEYWEFMARMFENLQGHSVYICCDFRIYDGLKPLVEAAGYKIKHCIVWKKNVWGLGKRYRFQHEFIIYACQDKAPFYGDRAQSDVWEIDIKKTTEHNTPKPVELPQRAITNSALDGAILYDGCCGHGTTIIAAHNLNRRCFAMEISDKYAAVILERFYTATGIMPELQL